MFARCTDAAHLLLADRRDISPLHGDIYHGNVLDFGERGWLAIDPKGLKGERGFDYANLLYGSSDRYSSRPPQRRHLRENAPPPNAHRESL